MELGADCSAIALNLHLHGMSVEYEEEGHQ